MNSARARVQISDYQRPTSTCTSHLLLLVRIRLVSGQQDRAPKVGPGEPIICRRVM